MQARGKASGNDYDLPSSHNTYSTNARFQNRYSQNQLRKGQRRRSSTTDLTEAAGKHAKSDYALWLQENAERLQEAVCWQKTRKFCRWLCENMQFTVFTTILTIYALFGDDIRLAATKVESDGYFNIVTITCLTVFTIELIAGSIGKDGYFMSFFFMLDFVATVSLVADITYVAEKLFSTESTTNDTSSVARAGRASRAGTRAGRVIRIVRLIRLVRIVKLYKHALEAKARAAQRARVEPGGLEDEADEEEDEEETQDHARKHKQSRVGKVLSEKTTLSVIVLVLTMLLVLPFLSTEYQGRRLPTSADYALDMMVDSWIRLHGGRQEVELQAKGNLTHTQMHRHWRDLYYRDVLRLVYYHNINFGEDARCGSNMFCPAAFTAKVLWLGYKDGNEVRYPHFKDLYVPEEKFISGQPFYNIDGEFTYGLIADVDKFYSQDVGQFEPGHIPEDVIARLHEPWTDHCRGTKPVSDFGNKAVSLVSGSPYGCPNLLRYNERILLVPLGLSQYETDKYGAFLVFLDNKTLTELGALFSIGMTCFVVVVLGFAAFFFTKDANELVLKPIERMIHKMDRIRDNPLEAIKLGDEEYRREEVKKRQRLQQKRRQEEMKRQLQAQEREARVSVVQWLRFRYQAWQAQRRETIREKKTRAEQKLPMETVILEKTIIKLGGLLVLGFGEAGAEIIGQNMKGSDSASVNALIPGQKVEAIFAFCGVRHFSVATQVLQDKVMLYLNEICEIVHGCTDDFNGAPNKNSGDSFLLVWRISGMEFSRMRRTADLVVVCLMHIIGAINKSPRLYEYRFHPGFQQRLSQYRVSVNFGLNSGWAIEGAIGSEFKIDASYLSPNVNMAARLEKSAERYGIHILVAHWFTELCSKLLTQNYFRIIDHVLERGSVQPVRLYSCDVDVLSLQIEYRNAENFVKNKYECRKIREQRKNDKMTDPNLTLEYWLMSEMFQQMRAKYTKNFLMHFSISYRFYEVGDWDAATNGFKTTRDLIHPPDGPSAELIDFMSTHNNTPPASWKGYREISLGAEE